MILIVLDTVRADHLKAYGYHRDTMPRLEQFARGQGVLVEWAAANSSWTTPTHGSLFTGLYPPRHGAGMGPPPSVLSEPRPIAEGVTTLAEILAGRGYWTLAVSANHVAVRPSGFGRGFHVFRAGASGDHPAKARTPWTLVTLWDAPLRGLNRLAPFAGCEFFERTVPYRRARHITDEALGLVARAGERPFFLFLNYLDAHWPYRPPAPFDRFRSGSRQRDDGWARQAFREVLDARRDLSPRERTELVDRYDGELSYLDAELARLLAGLQRHPRWAETIVAITADHGESFGEHRYLQHGGELFEPLLRVPLVVKPGRAAASAPPPGTVLAGPMQSVDVFATLLELSGMALPAGIDGLPWGRARSQLLAWTDSNNYNARIAPERYRRSLRTAREGRWKLVHSSRGELQLFDLEQDPDELTNLADRHPEVCERLLAALDAVPAVPLAALPSRPLSAEQVQELRALGYLQ